MFPTTTLLTTLLLAFAVAANPVVVNQSKVSLPLARRLNVTSVHNLVRHDQNRAKALKARGTPAAFFKTEDVVNEPVDNQAVSYYATVQIGSPATSYVLDIDTGSSNTWVGAGKTYEKTFTATKTTNTVSVSYGSGSFSGAEYTDQVAIVPGLNGLTINRQSIGVASKSTGFNDGTDGILGIGPVDLTVGTLSPDTSTSIPTVTDRLFASGAIPSNMVGISFEPTTSEEVMNGELTWGGIDSSKYTGSITWIPVTSTSPAGKYWGIDQSVRYGTSTAILSSVAGIVDTGTSLVLLASDGFSKYKKATGATADSSTGLLKLTSANFGKLQSLFFIAGGTSFELTANGQIWPRSLNTFIGGTSSGIYLIVADLGSNSGEGLDFINGYAFLERFYSVFDTTNKQVGLATTPFTTATTN